MYHSNVSFMLCGGRGLGVCGSGCEVMDWDTGVRAWDLGPGGWGRDLGPGG